MEVQNAEKECAELSWRCAELSWRWVVNIKRGKVVHMNQKKHHWICHCAHMALIVIIKLLLFFQTLILNLVERVHASAATVYGSPEVHIFEVSIPKRNPNMKSRNQIPTRNPEMKSRNEIPKRNPEMKSRNEIPKWNPETKSRHEIPKRNPNMKSRHEIPKRNPNMKSRHEIPKRNPEMKSWNEIPTRNPETKSRNEILKRNSNMKSRNEPASRRSGSSIWINLARNSQPASLTVLVLTPMQSPEGPACFTDCLQLASLHGGLRSWISSAPFDGTLEKSSSCSWWVCLPSMYYHNLTC